MKEQNNSAQVKANRNWRKKNPDKARYINAKSAARRFIRNFATNEDLDEIIQISKEQKMRMVSDSVKMNISNILSSTKESDEAVIKIRKYLSDNDEAK